MKFSQRRIVRRQIRVGERVVTGAVCPVCVMATVIYPETALDGHLAHHVMGEHAVRYRRGRPPGSRNIKQMSSTGVSYKRGIRGSVR